MMAYHQKLENFLNQDRAIRMREANAREAERKKQLELAKEREKEIEAKIQEELRQWKTFYDGNGFNMRMHFVWNFDHYFFVSPVDLDIKENSGHKHNYIWSTSNYPNGNDTIQYYDGTCKQFFGDSFGRDKGKHIVREYCGTKTKFVDQ